MTSAEVLEELNTYGDLYSYLSNHTGLTIRDPDDVQSIYSTLKAEVGTSLVWSLFEFVRHTNARDATHFVLLCLWLLNHKNRIYFSIQVGLRSCPSELDDQSISNEIGQSDS